MKIKNLKTKIVHVGNKSLLPDQTATISEKSANSPATKKFIKMKILAVLPDDTIENNASETTEPVVDDGAGNDETAEVADTENSAKKSSRKSTK